MYEYLDGLDPKGGLLNGLAPLSQSEIDQIAKAWPGIPDDYLVFLRERGAGGMEEGFHFVFLRAPLDAERDVFKDDLVTRNGAKGPICVFGHDQSGLTFGFDAGDEWRILEIDEYRELVPLDLSFRQFAEGLLQKYPQTPR